MALRRAATKSAAVGLKTEKARPELAKAEKAGAPVSKKTKAPASKTSRSPAPKKAKPSEPAAKKAKASASEPAASAGPSAAAVKRAHDAFPKTFAALRKAHPDAHCELDHKDAFQLIVATVLSAQSTDVAVNRITPGLFERWPNAKALSSAQTSDVESVINKIGMFRQKAKNLVGLAQGLVQKHGGNVPQTLDDLVALPGVGRKTANVVLGVAFGKPEGVVVDTHVQRISQRLGWTREQSPEKIEADLMKLVPRKDWDIVSHTLIFHGRRVCAAQRPACAACSVNTLCPSAFAAESVGRKAPKSRTR